MPQHGIGGNTVCIHPLWGPGLYYSSGSLYRAIIWWWPTRGLLIGPRFWHYNGVPVNHTILLIQRIIIILYIIFHKHNTRPFTIFSKHQHNNLSWFYSYQDNKCKLLKKPFRGAECSDAVGRQVAYSTMMKQVNTSLSGRIWDDVQKASFYNYKVCSPSYILFVFDEGETRYHSFNCFNRTRKEISIRFGTMIRRVFLWRWHISRSLVSEGLACGMEIYWITLMIL